MAAVRAVQRNALIRSAATVMLVRDQPDLHVFVVRRTSRAVFGPGATVFPGGAVDAADSNVTDRIVGLDDEAASGELGMESGGLARRVAAVRECFEEAGILLASPGRASATDALPLDLPDLRAWRDALNAGHATLDQVLE